MSDLLFWKWRSMWRRTKFTIVPFDGIIKIKKPSSLWALRYILIILPKYLPWKCKSVRGVTFIVVAIRWRISASINVIIRNLTLLTSFLRYYQSIISNFWSWKIKVTDKKTRLTSLNLRFFFQKFSYSCNNTWKGTNFTHTYYYYLVIY